MERIAICGFLRGYGALAEHYEIWTAGRRSEHASGVTLATAGANPIGAATLDAFRIAEGIPTYGVDMVERDLPQETSQMRALHFNKGCYLGQEIVERIRSRGNVHQPFALAGAGWACAAERGQNSTSGEAQAGQITSAAELPLTGGSRVFALGNDSR